MSRITTISLAVLALACGAGVSACNPFGGGDKTAQSSPAAQSKLVAYTGVFNTLIGGTPQSYSGLTGWAEAYLGANIASASPRHRLTT